MEVGRELGRMRRAAGWGLESGPGRGGKCSEMDEISRSDQPRFRHFPVPEKRVSGNGELESSEVQTNSAAIVAVEDVLMTGMTFEVSAGIPQILAKRNIAEGIWS